MSEYRGFTVKRNREAVEGSFLGSPSTGEPACPRYPNPATSYI